MELLLHSNLRLGITYICISGPPFTHICFWNKLSLVPTKVRAVVCLCLTLHRWWGFSWLVFVLFCCLFQPRPVRKCSVLCSSVSSAVSFTNYDLTCLASSGFCILFTVSFLPFHSSHLSLELLGRCNTVWPLKM